MDPTTVPTEAPAPAPAPAPASVEKPKSVRLVAHQGPKHTIVLSVDLCPEVTIPWVYSSDGDLSSSAEYLRDELRRSLEALKAGTLLAPDLDSCPSWDLRGGTVTMTFPLPKDGPFGFQLTPQVIRVSAERLSAVLAEAMALVSGLIPPPPSKSERFLPCCVRDGRYGVEVEVSPMAASGSASCGPTPWKLYLFKEWCSEGEEVVAVIRMPQEASLESLRRLTAGKGDLVIHRSIGGGSGSDTDSEDEDKSNSLGPRSRAWFHICSTPERFTLHTPFLTVVEPLAAVIPQLTTALDYAVKVDLPFAPE